MPRLAVIPVSLIVMAASVLAASAQAPAPPVESVTVTQSHAALEKFAKSFTVATKLTGKIARWERGICPVTVGQQSPFTDKVTQRVRDVAAMTGVPINAVSSCKPNIEIVFTSTPQELLNSVRKDDPDYLGYAESSAEKDRLATVTRPIQAWYTTETTDLNGVSRIDTGRRLAGGIELPNFTSLPCPTCGTANRDPIYFPYATYAQVTGNHIQDGMRSGFNHILIVVDTYRVLGLKIDPLANYIAMLALTQLNSLDTCQQLPSIVNMFAAGCEQKVDEMTDVDLAYLRGLYKASADKSLVVQQNDIADQMKEALGR